MCNLLSRSVDSGAVLCYEGCWDLAFHSNVKDNGFLRKIHKTPSKRSSFRKTTGAR